MKSFQLNCFKIFCYTVWKTILANVNMLNGANTVQLNTLVAIYVQAWVLTIVWFCIQHELCLLYIMSTIHVHSCTNCVSQGNDSYMLVRLVQNCYSMLQFNNIIQNSWYSGLNYYVECAKIFLRIEKSHFHKTWINYYCD